jgi:hypothetical protein
MEGVGDGLPPAWNEASLASKDVLSKSRTVVASEGDTASTAAGYRRGQIFTGQFAGSPAAFCDGIHRDHFG